MSLNHAPILVAFRHFCSKKHAAYFDKCSEDESTTSLFNSGLTRRDRGMLEEQQLPRGSWDVVISISPLQLTL